MPLRSSVLIALALAAVPAVARAQHVWRVDSLPSRVVRSTDDAGRLVFGVVHWATRLSTGSIVVADGSAPGLTFIPEAPAAPKLVGRAGDGPTDFRLPAWVGACGRDDVYVWDIGKSSLEVYDLGGSRRRSFELLIRPGVPPRLRCNRLGEVLTFTGARNSSAARGRGAATPFFVDTIVATPTLLRADGAELSRLPPAAVREVILGSAERRANGGLPWPLSAATTYALDDQHVYAADPSRSMVSVYDKRGTLLRGFSVPAASVQASAREYETAADEIVAEMADLPTEFRSHIRRMLDEAPRPSRLPSIRGIFADQAGGVWVHSAGAGDSTTLHGFRPSGAPLATIIVPRRMEVVEVGVNHVLGTDVDADGEPVVLLYRYVRRHSPGPR